MMLQLRETQSQALAIALLVAFIPTSLGDACQIYVDYTKGSDSASGSIGQPVKTIEGALTRTRAAGCTNVDKSIVLRSGTHLIQKTIYLQGDADSNLSMTGYGPDLAQGLGRPVVSGGISVGPWKAMPNGMYQAQVPSGSTRPKELYINGRWGQRARMPKSDPTESKARFMGKGSTFRWVSPLQPCDKSVCPDADRWGFVYNSSDPISNSWYNVDEVDVLVFHSWTAFWSQIGSIHPENKSIIFESASTGPVGQYATQGGQRYLLENVFEGLDEPGEWYWDSSKEVVTTIPEQQGIEISAIAPQVDQLFVIKNSSNMELVDLEFRHATSERINVYFPSTAAIHIQGSNSITINRTAVMQCGGSGIIIEDGSQNVVIENSAVKDVGGEGIAIRDSTVSDIHLNNNLVNNTALVILGQPMGIRLRGSANITAMHNSVSFSPYGGIGLGWQTGYDAARANGDPIFMVEKNLVHDYGLGILSDFGGIYLSSNDNLCFQKDPVTCYLPTVLKNNVIHDCTYFNYGCEGVYMDEQVSGVNIISNILYNLEDGGVYFHCGTDNTAAGNIVAETKSSVMGCNSGGNPTYPTIIRGFNWTNNIIYVPEDVVGQVAFKEYGKNGDYFDTTFAKNLYFSPNCTSSTSCDLMFPANKSNPKMQTWSEWQSSGQDRDSILADPMFTDFQSRNFKLKPGSPALDPSFGFVQFDQSEAGCDNNPWSK